LRAITGYSEILLEDYHNSLDENGQKILANVISAGKRMNQMIEDLLKYSRLGRQSIQMQNVNISKSVENVLNDLSVRINETQASIQTSGIDGHLDVWGDPTLVRQILSNLIDNAITYTRPETKPEIQIAVEPAGNWVFLRVIDHGIGIQADDFDKIFKVFQRLHTDNQYSGSGIGLALVKKAVERLNGEISVESVVDQGSTFTVKLPGPDDELMV
jgi:signal transduction histidine kinase